MGENESANLGSSGGTDGGDNRGSSERAESESVDIVVGGDDGGNARASRGGSGDGSGGRGRGSGVQSASGSRRERSERNKREHASSGTGSRKAVKPATRVQVSERRSRAKPAEKASVIPPQPLGDMVGVVFTITATRRGELWKLAPEEQAAIGDALANVLRHVPMPEKQVGIAADIAALGFVSYAIVVPRLEADRKLRALSAPSPIGQVRPTEVVRAVAVEEFQDPFSQAETDAERFGGSQDPSVIARLPIG